MTQPTNRVPSSPHCTPPRSSIPPVMPSTLRLGNRGCGTVTVWTSVSVRHSVHSSLLECSSDLLPVLLDRTLAGVAACPGQGGVPTFGTVGAVPLIVWRGRHLVQEVALRWWHSLQVVALSTDSSTWYRGWHSVQAVALSAGGSTQYSQDYFSQCLKKLPLRDDQLEVHSSTDGCIPSERPAIDSKQASIGLFSGSGNM